MRSRPLAAILLTLTLSAAACQLVWSYDDFKDQPGTGGSGGGSSSSSGGSGGSSSSSDSSSSSSSSGGCTFDHDMDGVLSWKCDPTDHTLDCADFDERAFPGADFEASPIVGVRRLGTQPWDFNCDDAITQETPIAPCGGFLFCGGSGIQPGTAPECGQSYTLGHCAPFGFLFSCVWTPENPLVTVVQRCK